MKSGRRAGLAALFGVLLAGAGAGAVHADVVTDWNATLLDVIRATSGTLQDGPPEVAREMAIVGTAMNNAAMAAAPGEVTAAVNSAAYTAMLALFTPAGTAGLGGAPDNVNTGNTTTIGNLWSPSIVAAVQSRITGTYNAIGAQSATGTQAASDVIQARNGSLVADSVAGLSFSFDSATKLFSVTGSVTSDAGDGSYAAIVKGLDRTQYSPATNALLAPGADAATGVGVYVQPGARPAMYPTWNTVTPFSSGGTTINISDATSRISGPPDVTGAVYANALMQTYCTGGNSASASFATVCNAAHMAGVNTSAAGTLGGVSLTDNALFWNDPGTTDQPPGHWLDITNQVIAAAAAAGTPLTLLQETELVALIGEAEADAGIAAWSVKYVYNLWRPITAITGNATCQYTQGNTVWNTTLASYGFTCDPTWKSVIVTPPHPDYIAGHPAFSGAAATVLTDFFGTSMPGFTFSDTSDSYCNGSTPTAFDITGQISACSLAGSFVPGITETFDDFFDASNAATDSRVNGGIHTPFAVADALAVGNAIGAMVANDAGFATVPEPASWIVIGSALFGLARLRRRTRLPV